MSPHRAPRPRRSFIFTPGLRPDMFPKALVSGADIVCVELEDGIAPKDKTEARRRALALFERSQADDGVERIVRINSMRERFGIESAWTMLLTVSTIMLMWVSDWAVIVPLNRRWCGE